MKNQSIWMLGAAAVLVASGCGYSAPYRTSGPSLSDRGVQVGLAGIRCYVNRGADPLTDAADEDQAGLEVKLQISNKSGQVAEVAEKNILLTETDGPMMPAAPPRRSEVIALLPGETRQVPLKFMPRGVADCHRAFELEFADTVEVAGAPVSLSPIDFQAKP